MAEGFGPDEELLSRQQSMDEAMRRLRDREQAARRFRPPYLAAAESGPLRDRIESEYGSALDSAQRARDHYLRGAEDHPSSLLESLQEGMQTVRAPQLSGYEWWRQNPGFMEATPLTQDQRDANARQLYVLDRIRAHAERHPSSSPFAIENYRGPDADFLSEAMVRDADRQMSPAVQELLESPYAYTPKGYTPELEPLSPQERVLEPLNRAYGALWGGTERFADNFLAGGRDLARGQLSSAAKDFAYAVPNLVSPLFHRGGAGSEQDWRPDAGPMASGIELAGELPFWFYQGVMPGRAMSSGQRIRALVDRDALKSAYQKAAWKTHPDYGGSNEAMQRLNTARDRGDLDAILRMAQ